MMEERTIELLKEYDSDIKILNLSNMDIEGELDISQFDYLEEIYINNNEITKINLHSNSSNTVKKFNAEFNNLENVVFLNSLDSAEYINVNYQYNIEYINYYNMSNNLKVLEMKGNKVNKWGHFSIRVNVLDKIDVSDSNINKLNFHQVNYLNIENCRYVNFDCRDLINDKIKNCKHSCNAKCPYLLKRFMEGKSLFNF